ncbi:hypothetical protein ABS772_17680 [Methylorubrum podarium]|uniref:Uncharacterized protein n=1 Tax=Methylorubrum podarium TaxID=200476 RepID=A0ABV1QQR0_9HYPH
MAKSGTAYWRGGLLTLAEADACVEDLRAMLSLCGAALACSDHSPNPHTPNRPRPPG